MGIVDSSRKTLGSEYSGIVRNIGSKVKGVQIGDRVLAVNAGSFASRIVISENYCAKMPDDLTFEEGATMPCVYVTVIHSLINIGRVKKGQVGHFPEVY